MEQRPEHLDWGERGEAEIWEMKLGGRMGSEYRAQWATLRMKARGRLTDFKWLCWTGMSDLVKDLLDSSEENAS